MSELSKAFLLFLTGFILSALALYTHHSYVQHFSGGGWEILKYLVSLLTGCMLVVGIFLAGVGATYPWQHLYKDSDAPPPGGDPDFDDFDLD